MTLKILWRVVQICQFAKSHEKPHKNVIFQSPVANIYSVIGCKKSVGMVSRVPKSNMVTSPFFTLKSVIFKKGYCTYSVVLALNRCCRSAKGALGEKATFDLSLLAVETGVVEEAGEGCAVCLAGLAEGEEVAVLGCGHTFHAACMARWVGEGHFSCPYCRAEVARRE